MSVPVSKYEELLETVRCLKLQTIRVRELASPLLHTIIDANCGASSVQRSGPPCHGHFDWCDQDAGWRRKSDQKWRSDLKEQPPLRTHSAGAMESIALERQHKSQMHDEDACGSHSEGFRDDTSPRHHGTHMSVSSDPESSTGRNMSMLYHGTWPVERAMWNSEPTNLTQRSANNQIEMTSVISFASSSGAAPLEKVLHRDNRTSSQQLEVKVDMVYSLLSMLGTQECPDMGETLLALSSSPESSLAMRQAGCLPVLVQLVYSDKDRETREKALKAMLNLVQVQSDEKLKKREMKLLRQLEDIRNYCDNVLDPNQAALKDDMDGHPTQITENFIKLSFDEGYRQTICELGGIYALARLIEIDHVVHMDIPENDQCVTLRRYAGMALTNLTFGSSQNKALLCSFRGFMKCLVVQLKSQSVELRQVTACVLRNLSWRPDESSKVILREVGSVPALMSAAIISEKESTLKAILSALWNLSSHCSMNKADICSVEGALGFLVDMLSYKSPSKTLTITETVGGIFRNISNHIAVREDYRTILREHNCLQVLLQHLKSPSLAIVSNACGTLWNLSARCTEDQKALWEMGAVPMLRSLNHSKHMLIATGSRAALKNLLSSKPCYNLLTHVDSTSREMGLPALPTLGARKIRALVKDLQTNLSETCDSVEPTSPRESYSLGETSKPTSPSWKFKYTELESPRDEPNLESHSMFDNRNVSNDDNQISEAFSSLNINDRCKKDNEDQYLRKTHYSQNNYGSASLPFSNSRPNRSSSSFIPVRNKYSDCSFEDEQDVSEQPVDYSQKYAETKIVKPYTSITESSSKTEDCKESVKKEPTEFVYVNKPLNCPKNTVSSYGDYAETDLDQPTDYSLRYAENDSDSDEMCKNSVDRTEQFYEEQDTIKTYYTEGTPYETPYNFSTATSMSDLRMDGAIDDKMEIKKEEKQEDEKESAKIPENVTDKKPKSCFSSGLMSPEKPVNYCEEGTPRYFSRVSSFSSLNSAVEENAIKNIKSENLSEENTQKNLDYVEPENEEVKIENKDREAGKVVTFGQVVDYAEETPLMFSRCSSLGSLSSAEQHSIHDDRSSVISDFSRLTSGIISPSELPDSPTQTVPPSPRHRKAHIEFPVPTSEPTRNMQKSVFEDNVIKFKEVNTPVDFSTNTSLSSLTIDDEPNITSFALLQNNTQKQSDVVDKDSENIKKQNDNLDTTAIAELAPVSEGEEDGEEDMLAACINIGMQNNRHRQNKQMIPKPRSSPSGLPKFQIKPAQRTSIPVKFPTSPFKQESRLPVSESRIKPPEMMNSDTIRTYCTEDTPAMLSHAGSHSDLSVLSISSKEKLADEKPDYSDESSNMSGDNDSMLAECIQSGMPKAKKQIIPPKIVTHKRNTQSEPVSIQSPQRHLQQKIMKNVQYTAARDEVESYAVEDSPCHFSLRSSLSDLTVDGNLSGLQRRQNKDSFDKSQTQYCSNYNPYSPIYEAGCSKDVQKKSASPSKFNREGAYGENSEEPVTVLSRNGSLSSLSVESSGSTENAEQALLEQCISSGMPKSKSSSSSKLVMDIVSSKSLVNTNNIMSPECSNSFSKSNSKNVYAASVVMSTPTKETVQYPSPARTAGVENQADIEERENSIDENLLTEETKSGYDVINKCSDMLLDGSIEDNVSPDNSDSEAARFRKAQNRMLDPDAMIESLDRFTAELVSQSSHLQHSQIYGKMTNMTQSGNEGDTWNEDTSPIDVSFPSISVSAPLAASFKSEQESDKNMDMSDCPTDNLDIVDGIKLETQEPEESNNFSSLNTTTLTDSTLIAIEATKIVNVVKSEMVQSITSITSLELDQVKPPSMMESLVSMTSSTSGHWERQKIESNSVNNSPKPSRKKSLPAGLMVRRALGNTHQTKSLESLADVSISSSCNLDHVKPPSVMGEYLDMVDMENSMISVASITSEVADNVKTDFIPNGPVKEHYDYKCASNWMFEVKQPNMMNLLTSSLNQYSISDIENINPPSLLNEVTDMCNSTADVVSDNIYSETEVFEDCFTHVADQTLQTADEVTEYSDANSLTPVQSDFGSSSAESTPKKVKNINKRLTPKQKRQMIKERYKTYTVAAEMVIREEHKLQSDKSDMSPDSTTEYMTAQINQCNTVSSSIPTKLTPKERRQQDRARFQTRVVGNIDFNTSPIGSSDPESNQSNVQNKGSKLEYQRALRQKRLDNKDRFRTRTLSSDGASVSPDISPAPELRAVATFDLHTMLEYEANKVLDNLKQTSKYDDLLDCETLSLVSNEDDVEHNSVSSVNYRTYHKSWSFNKNLPVVQSSTDINSSVDIAHVNVNNINEEQIQSEELLENDSIVKSKPKIVKPVTDSVPEDSNEESEEVKGIRGRRKPLYSPSKKPATPSTPSRIKPIKTMTSNLVKNVTSTLKTGTVNKLTSNKPQVKSVNTKPPAAQKKPLNGTKLPNKIPKVDTSKSPKKQIEPPKAIERQGTFTKDEQKQKVVKNIPEKTKSATSRIARAIIGKTNPTPKAIPKLQLTPQIPKLQSAPQTPKFQSRTFTSTSADRIKRLSEGKPTFYSRSPSADRDISKVRTSIHGSSSSQSLQNGENKLTTINKRSSIPNMAQRSNSNVSITSTESTKKKQVTSKIASLWKRVEQSKKQPPKNDTRVWITNQKETNGEPEIEQVKLREKKTNEDNTPKRISRLGSFIQVDEGDKPSSQKSRISVS